MSKINETQGILPETSDVAAEPNAAEPELAESSDDEETAHIKLKKLLGETEFKAFDDATARWSEKFFRLMWDQKEGLRKLVQDDDFNIMCSKHEQIKDRFPELVPQFLLEEVRYNQIEFLIPYTFITGSDNKEFKYIHLASFECATGLSGLLEPYHNHEE